VLLLAGVSPAWGYSVLTHEAVVDSLWMTDIKPLLVKRFPQSTDEDLRKAHAYVYGGGLVADMGYVPFSSKFMSDLAHYVRPGAFVQGLIDESQTLNEYAFALGSLAHYSGDTTGHPTVNRITVLAYPKFRAKYPNGIAFEDAPSQHLKTEFSLDVVQVARGLYAPDAYHDFIGFEVEAGLIERTFPKVYGLEFKDLFSSEDLAIGTFRFSVGSAIPKMTRVAWDSKRKDIAKLSPGITRSKVTYRLPRREYEKRWGTTYKMPGFSERILAILFRLVPHAGPFKALGFRPVTSAGEKMFLESLDATLARYHGYLADVGANRLKLADLNLDTGLPVKPGEYWLADEAYVELVHRLAEHNFDSAPPEMRAAIEAYFSDPARISEKARKVQTAGELERLHAIQ
jgi:Zinc dependent phospholipase C